MMKLWNDDGSLNPDALFEQVDDCSVCPLSPDNERQFRCEHICNGSPDCFIPCQYMDEYGKMTLQELVDEMNERVRRVEEYWERQWLAKKEKDEKNAASAKKRNQTRLANYGLNKEITRLRKLIRDRESAIQSLTSLHSAFGFVNALMDGKDPNNVPVENEQVRIWKDANIRDNKKLEELLKERDRRNKERRKTK